VAKRRDLRGQDFRGRDLRGEHFSLAQLAGADFRDAVLDGTVWHRAVLTGARFDPGVLAGLDTLGAALPDRRPSMQVSPGSATIWEIALHPGDDLMATSGTDGGVWCWDTRACHPLRRFDDHLGWVHALAFSPDGTMLATGGDDGMVRVRDLRTDEVWTVGEDCSFVRSVAFSPSGAHLAAAGDDSVVRVWSGNDLVFTFAADRQRMDSVAFSPDGTIMVVACGGLVQVFQTGEWQPLRQVEPEIGWVTGVAFEDGRLVLSGRSSPHELRTTWDWRTWQETGRSEHRIDFETSEFDIVARACSPDGKTSVRANRQGTIFVDSGRRRPKRIEPVDVTARALAVDEDVTAVAGNQGVWLWDRGRSRRLADPDLRVNSLALSPDGMLLAGCGERRVVVWDVTTGRVLTKLDARGWVHDVAISPDGSTLAAHGAQGVLRWSVDRWQPLDKAELPGYESLNWPVVGFAQDGTLLVAGGNRVTVPMWRGDSHHDLRVAGTHGPLTRPVTFSPNGMVMAIGLDGALELWDAATGEIRHRLTGYRNDVAAVAFTRDGRYVAAGGMDRVIRIWDADTGQLENTLPHNNFVYALAYRPDGTLVSGGGDGVRVWDGAAVVSLTGWIPGASWQAIGLCRFENGDLSGP
jgi:WD40 repeat protein